MAEMKRPYLMPVQRDLIQRLRDVGYNALADAAQDAWAYGERVNMPDLILDRYRGLREEYQRANLEAGPDIGRS